MTAHVFISYARTDGRDYAAKLETALQAAGFRTWWDVRNLDPHQDFTGEIEQGISDAEQVVVCLTPDIKRSDSFVRREIQYALVSKKRIIPLRFADVVPPIHIINLTWIDFYTLGWDQAFIDLRQRLDSTNDTYEVHVAPPDPYREYLKALYDQTVSYLQQTVFAMSSALIELRAESQPDAVIQQQALPLAFFEQAGVAPSQREHKHFSSFHEAFEYYRGRMLVLGDPGAGKTTTLLAFVRDVVAKRLEDPTQRLPITAPISTWKGEPLEDWLAAQIPLLKHDDLSLLLANDKTLLVLDGLDELGSERQDPDTKENFDPRPRFLSLIPSKNQTIISCRTRDYTEVKQKANLVGAIILYPLEDVQMQNYLSDQPELWVALQGDDDLRELARTPLLLSLFAYAYREAPPEELQLLRDLRASPGDLRDRILGTYVKRRYEHEERKYILRDEKLQLTLKEISETLGQVTASVMLSARHGHEHITTADFSEFVRDSNSATISSLCLDLHYLIDLGNNVLQFPHFLLRNYFAFPYILSSLGDEVAGEDAAYALGEIGDVRAISSLIAAMADDDQPIRRASSRALAMFGERAIEPLINNALSSHNTSIWTRGSKALALIGSTAVESLIAVLNHSNGRVRAGAEIALGEIGDERAVVPLVGLLGDDSRGIRFRATEALGEIRARSAFEPLVKVLQNDTDATVRAGAAWALAKIDRTESLPYLITALADNNEVVFGLFIFGHTVSEAAARALEITIRTPEALAALKMWQREQEKQQRDS